MDLDQDITSPARSHPPAAGRGVVAVRRTRKGCQDATHGKNLDLVVATDTCHDCTSKEGNQEARHGMW